MKAVYGKWQLRILRTHRVIGKQLPVDVKMKSCSLFTFVYSESVSN